MIVETLFSVNPSHQFSLDPAQGARVWQNEQVNISDQSPDFVNVSRPRLFWWQRLIQRFTASRWASRLLTRRLHRWDGWVHRLSKGRWTATEILSGLPVIFITTAGVQTGLPHTTPLLAIEHEGQFLLIATKFGANHHPDWYRNIKANPRVEVLYKNRHSVYRARELNGEERMDGWARAISHYPGYQAYERRAGGRLIPIIALTPIED
jgi:deazaflavin-dependent oxidoreductase (nitroreductase family)